MEGLKRTCKANMNIAQLSSCCGVGELEGLNNDPVSMVEEVVLDHWDIIGDGEYYNEEVTSRLYVFSDIDRQGRYGAKLARYIKTNKLGTVYASSAQKNPNTSNDVRVYVWTIAPNKLKAWGKSHGILTKSHKEEEYPYDW